MGDNMTDEDRQFMIWYCVPSLGFSMATFVFVVELVAKLT